MFNDEFSGSKSKIKIAIGPLSTKDYYENFVWSLGFHKLNSDEYSFFIPLEKIMKPLIF